ncbi:hypothetical protein HW561_06760 [Rhodobacteraceae bacterium B1Z28]|uniref:Secreted protein n=1 Tax=Ruegeria haliotis TaxID=2747601 RepID=A0ABX2PMX4_9RHOB|nr:hypothetical protein [Ruegeria haliotis]NVO55485.1 hypothetical protein [Ruegeria haliotis]
MRFLSMICALTAANLLAGCPPQDLDPDPPPDAGAFERCLERGGSYEIAGRARQHVCFTPLPDAGKSCEMASDCQGYCLSETKQCSAETPQFGCIAHLDESGRELVICID